MRENILIDGTAADQRKFVDDIVARGFDFVGGMGREGGFLNYASLAELKEMIAERLPVEGMSLQDLMLTLSDKISKYSIAQSDQTYLAFPDCANSIAALGADILASFLNQNLIAVDRSAPIASVLEAQLILWLRQLIGYPTKPLLDPEFALSDVGGLWTTGGNMSNTVALVAALVKRFPDVPRTGLRGCAKTPCFVLSKGIEHFSFANAARFLGLGEESIIWADTGEDFRTDPDGIERALRHCPKDRQIFAVVAVAGNCRTTTIDRIPEILSICQKYGVWLHVDACHGGSLLFSKYLRERLDGIERADSVSLDPHKGLFVNYPSSYVLFKDASVPTLFSRYPSLTSMPNCLDLGQLTPFLGSRGFHSLKLWALLKHAGLQGVADIVERRQELNRIMTEELLDIPFILPINENSFYRQAFVIFGPDVRRLIEAGENKTEDKRVEIGAAISFHTKEFTDELYLAGSVCFDTFSLVDFGNSVGLGSGMKLTVAAMAVGHVEIKPPARRKIWSEVERIARKHYAELVKDLDGTDARSAFVDDCDTRSPASW